jgi:hypothetical protein
MGDGERNRHRPGHAVGQTHIAADSMVISALHEPFERRIGSSGNHFQVSNLARIEMYGRHAVGRL